MNDEPHATTWCERLTRAEAAPHCLARRGDGAECQTPAMRNRRCRMHGGKSTGPRTAAWLERSRRARWRHGHYSAEAKAERGLSEVVKIVTHVSIETSVEFLLKALRIQPTRVISIHGQPAARTHGQATSWAHGLASAWSHGVLNALTPSLCTHDARRGEQAGGGIDQQADRAFHVRLRKGGPYSAFYVRRASTPARALLPLQERKHSDP